MTLNARILVLAFGVTDVCPSSAWGERSWSLAIFSARAATSGIAARLANVATDCG